MKHDIRRPLFLRLFMVCLSLAGAFQSRAQSDNQILDPDIKSAQLYLSGTRLTNPVVELRASRNMLRLDFDHLGGDIKNYIYTLVHCNSDWQPSELQDNEYIDGFTEDRITQVETSINTLMAYTRYSLALPNANMRWTRSGNYLLKIFDEDNDRELVLVRRFLVVEPLWRIEAKTVQPLTVDKRNTHQEIHFNILHRNFRINNPQKEVKAYILQNFRWDVAVGPLPPQPSGYAPETLTFDYLSKIQFPAGKEWRYFDMRSFDQRGEQVHRIGEFDDYYEVTLKTDKVLPGHSYAKTGDLNGRYLIEHRAPGKGPLECDYARVLFSLDTPYDEEKDIYVFGELSDWVLQPEFQLEYNNDVKAYICEPLLKQGFYNYHYVVVDRESNKLSEDGLDGNWYETGNQYTILTYYRPFGERYDRLLGAATIDSRRQ